MMGKEFGLELKNIFFSYGKKKILDNLNLEVNKGEVVAVIGDNGCGKTTILKLICGLLIPNKGKVHIESCSDADIPIAGIIESPRFWGEMTGIENATYYLGKKYNEKVVEDFFELFSISDYSTKVVKDYSLGMRQKLAIIIAFASDAPILIFDEPINSLDQQSVELFFDLVNKASDKGRIIIFTTHIMSSLFNNCTNVYCLKDKKLRIIDESQDVGYSTYEIVFRTTEDAKNAYDIISKYEVVEIKKKTLLIILKKFSISEVLRMVCHLDVIEMMKKNNRMY